jgi:hypothetical protein
MFTGTAALGIYAFTAGVIIQSFAMLGGRFEKGDLWKIGAALIFGLAGLAPGKHESGTQYIQSFGVHILFALTLYSGTFAAVFDKKLLSPLNQQLLIVWNLLLLYAMAVAHLNIWWFAAVLLPTAFVILNAFYNIDGTFVTKVLLYGWFIVILVGLGLLHISYGNLALFFNNFSDTSSLHLVEMFLTGTVFFYLVANIWYLLRLIPVTKKNQSTSDRMWEIRADLELMASEYIWEKDNRIHNALVIALVTTVLAINYFYNFIPSWFLIIGSFGIVTLVNHLRISLTPKGTQPAAPAIQ